MTFRDANNANDVQWLSPESTVIQIAQMMEQNDVGSIPISKDNQVIGFITNRDIVLAAAKGTLEGILAKDIMTDVFTVTADLDGHDPARLISKDQIRRDYLFWKMDCDLALETIPINEAGDAPDHISLGGYH